MPYFTRQSTNSQETADVTTEFYNFQGTQFGSRNRSVKSLTTNPVYSARRAGTNTSIPELIKVYGVGSLTLTKKKVFVGYEFRQEKFSVWYRARNGNLRSREVTKTKRFPKFITVTKARFNKPALGSVKTSQFYLKPNKLTFSNATNVCIPKSMTIVRESWTDSLGGYIDRRAIFRITGPGLYQTPDAKDLTVGIGNTNLRWIETWGGDSALAQDSLRRLYSKVARDIPDYMTAAAESRELFRTLQKIVLTSIKLVKDLKRLDLKRVRGYLKSSPQDLSSLWLTWVYGISPVVSDIVDTIDVVKRSDRTWRSFSAAVEKPTVTSTSLHPNFIGKHDTTVKHIERYGVIVEGRITVDSVYKEKVNWQGAISTAYQLIPFSFMLDWIVDIGEYLASSQIFEDKVYTAWRTSIRLEDSHQEGYFGLKPGGSRFNRMFSAPFSYHQRGCYVNRSPLSSLPAMPDIKVKKPSTDVLSLQRAINALAILVSTTDGLKRPPGFR